MDQPDFARRGLIATIAGLPLGAILADPRLARAAAETTQSVRINTQGGSEVGAALAKPAQVPAPAVMLVHEWWGLNDQIRTVARDLAEQGYLALAVDLYQGRVTTDPEEAKRFSQAIKTEEAADTLVSWAQWLSNHPEGNRKLGVVGWCLGGGWSLNASTLWPMDATVVYYGRANLPKEQLAKLKGPVLGHFARKDQFINAAMVAEFESTMKSLGKPYTIYWYDAGHAFANPTGANYQQADAKLAWERTTQFFAKNLKKGG